MNVSISIENECVLNCMIAYYGFKPKSKNIVGKKINIEHSISEKSFWDMYNQANK